MSQFPPESAFEPPGQPFDPPPGGPTKSNGMAITGLVFGLLGFCIPFLGGALAILFGAIGLSKAKDPRVGGRGMALTGLILGVLTIAAYGAVFALVVPLVTNAVQSAIATPGEFLTELGKGDATAALAKVDPARVDRAKVEKAIEEVKPWGPFKNFSSNNIQNTNINGITQMTMTGPAVFEKQTKTVEMTMTNSKAAFFTWKVVDWSFK